MTRNSLRFRFLTAAAVSIVVALVIAGAGLLALFERHVERRIGAELEIVLTQIVGNVAVADDGRVTLALDLADPRFAQPLSGLYWQIQDPKRSTLLRSRSLWDAVIELPGAALSPGTVYRHTLSGPGDSTLLVWERQIIFRVPRGEARPLRIAVAIDERELVKAREAFGADMLPYLALMTLVLVVAAMIQVRTGLAPLDAVRRGVTAIRAGTQRGLDGRYPEEVMPLVNELNGLLDSQARAIERARSWTADLAHGLKTPLTVLNADAQRLREQGNAQIADDLDQLAETMRRRVDRELIRARVRSSVQARPARADAGEAIKRVVRTLQRTPRGAALNWSLQLSEATAAAILPDDLTELLGNLLENACKWAEQAVHVAVSSQEGLAIHVEDDGPGVPPDQLEHLGRRGLRLDEQTSGSGLGLAIVRDIVEAYQGELTFAPARAGGLAVTVRLPADGVAV